MNKSYGKPISLNNSLASPHNKSNSSIPSFFIHSKPKSQTLRKKVSRTQSEVHFWNPLSSPKQPINNSTEKVSTTNLSNSQFGEPSPHNLSKGFELCYKLFPKPSFLMHSETKKKTLKINCEFSNNEIERSIQTLNHKRHSTITKKALGNLVPEPEPTPMTPIAFKKRKYPISFSKMVENTEKD
mmetsp:Transcript_32032/g.31742  ORF Transcript_32032/g.31742 Transcript_32032/m.31742 type:complete len:184 (-) Transcript_32032:2288-2839(-)